MTPQELKNSILQLAIQGKLVPQRAEEGTAEELYNQIQAEKQNLIKAGKIKKEKLLLEITDDEKPFEIPDSWKWVRFGNISQLLDGEKREGLKYPYLTVKYLRGMSEKVFESKGKFITKGTKVILVDGENSGEVFYAHEEGYMGSTFKVLYFSQILYESYILYFLLYHKKDYRNNKKGSAIPHLDKTLFFNMLLPIPPLAEQKRIVAKIEELLPYVERYEKAYNELQQLNKRFPGDLQKSVLQLAIQGRLVPQCPEEGNAEDLYKQIQAEKQNLIKAGKIKKEKLLPAITDDEKPFEIPQSWKWVRLGEVTVLNPKNNLDDNLETSFIPMTLISDGYANNHLSEIRRWVDIKSGFTHFANGDIGVAKITPCFQNKKSVIFRNLENGYGAGTTELIIIRVIENLILRKFILWFVKSDYFISNGVKSFTGTAGQQRIHKDYLKNCLFPLPPLAEQKRIVAKLEEILPLCDKLK